MEEADARLIMAIQDSIAVASGSRLVAKAPPAKACPKVPRPSQSSRAEEWQDAAGGKAGGKVGGKRVGKRGGGQDFAKLGEEDSPYKGFAYWRCHNPYTKKQFGQGYHEPCGEVRPSSSGQGYDDNAGGGRSRDSGQGYDDKSGSEHSRGSGQAHDDNAGGGHSSGSGRAYDDNSGNGGSSGSATANASSGATGGSGAGYDDSSGKGGSATLAWLGGAEDNPDDTPHGHDTPPQRHDADNDDDDTTRTALATQEQQCYVKTRTLEKGTLGFLV